MKTEDQNNIQQIKYIFIIFFKLSTVCNHFSTTELIFSATYFQNYNIIIIIIIILRYHLKVDGTYFKD